jgi:hypothetical protein
LKDGGSWRNHFVKFLLGIFLALGIAAGAYAAAASLIVNGGTVQAGSEIGLVCDPDGVDVSYGVVYDGSEFVIDEVTIDDIDAACLGFDITVVLTDGGVDVGSGTGAIAGASITIPIAALPDAEDVDDVHVAIH